VGNETISRKGGSDSACALLTPTNVSVSVLRRIVEDKKRVPSAPSYGKSVVKRSRLVVVSDEYASPKDFKFDPVAAGIVDAEAHRGTAEAPGGLLSSEPDKQPRSSLRMLMVLMERPFFSLSKRRLDPLHYLSPDGTIRIQVDPGPEGMATIYDADLVMFLVKELSEALAGSGDRAVVLKGAAYLRAVGAKNGGDQYALLAKAIRRLSTTRVTTNAGPDGKAGPTRSFCWFEEVTRKGNDWHIIVPAWLKDGARSKFVLDVCPEYFDLKGGFDRFLYLASRKHVGREPGKVFRIKLSTLWKKSGSGGKLAKFRHEIKLIATKNLLPEYWLDLKDEPRRDGSLFIRWR
jgi:hypothetical protein